MNREFLTYLKPFSSQPFEVNKLIVNNFLSSNNLVVQNNSFLKQYVIEETSSDYQFVRDFIQRHAIATLEDLIGAFEFVISPEDRVVTGAIYTPDKIRDFIIDETAQKIGNLETIKIWDPACGCAGFLFSFSKYLKTKTTKSYSEIFSENIYGLDIQEYSVERSKILLSLLALSEGEDEEAFNFNFAKGDALDFNWAEEFSLHEGFDIVIGNPPYVCSRNINEKTKPLLKKWQVCGTGHPDLYIPFFELGLSALRNGGILGYITMNTFFKSINGRALRQFLASGEYKNQILDFGGYQVFDSKSTYTCICLIEKTNTESLEYVLLNSLDQLNKKIKFSNLALNSLENFKGWNLQNVDTIKKIEAVGTPLGEKFKTRNGIATLKNEIYIFSPVKEDEKYYYLQNGSVFPIEKELCKEIINPNRFTKIKSVEKIKEKAIFPYTFQNDAAVLMEENYLAKKFPKAFHYLQQKRPLLELRDKGKSKYPWYAFGRNQSLEKMQLKLFFPHLSSSTPNFVVNHDENLLFYNGLALLGEEKQDLLVMQKLLSSKLFWFYITKSSKPYGSGYFSLSRNYIKNFGVYPFKDDEIEYIINESNKEKLDSFFESKYDIHLT